MRARPEDAARLKEIAVASKAYWGYPVEMIQCWAQTPIITPEAVADGLVFVAYNGQAAAGWYRLRAGAGSAEIEDLWVLPAFIGQGAGRCLFEHAVLEARRLGLSAIELDADPNAVGFYQHMGCRVIGESLSEWGRQIPRLRWEK